MALKDDIAADLAELELEMAPDGVTPDYFTWNAAQYPCVRGSIRRGKSLGSGGYALEADLVLFVRASFFADDGDPDSRPESKEIITFDGRSFRIDDVVTVAVGEPFLKLICTDPNQNR